MPKTLSEQLGDANKKMGELEGLLQAAAQKVGAAEKMNGEQAALITANATEIAGLKTQITDLTTEKTEVDSKLVAAEQARDASVAMQADFDKKVSDAAALKAQEIAAAQGIPPLAMKPASEPARNEPPKADLKGMDRVIAAFKAQKK